MLVRRGPARNLAGRTLCSGILPPVEGVEAEGEYAPFERLRGRRRPQGPVASLSDLERHFPDSHVVAFPHLGHSRSGVGGCIDPVVTDFVERGTTKGLDTTGSDGVVVVPPFPLTS